MLTHKALHVVTSSKKIKFLNPLQKQTTDLMFQFHERKADGNTGTEEEEEERRRRRKNEEEEEKRRKKRRKKKKKKKKEKKKKKKKKNSGCLFLSLSPPFLTRYALLLSPSLPRLFLLCERCVIIFVTLFFTYLSLFASCFFFFFFLKKKTKKKKRNNRRVQEDSGGCQWQEAW